MAGGASVLGERRSGGGGGGGEEWGAGVHHTPGRPATLVVLEYQYWPRPDKSPVRQIALFAVLTWPLPDAAR